MEKKSPIKDVHKVIQKDYVELYKLLNDKLGNKNPFAKFNIGGGFYLWSDNRYDWSLLSSATKDEESFILDSLLDVKKDVVKELGEKTAEVLFTVPDNNYIFYSIVDDDIKILITGWGFIKPNKSAGKRQLQELQVKNSKTISFIYDNEKLIDYEFGVQLPKQVKKFSTDHNGIYKFSDLKVNNLTLINLSTNEIYNLEILDSKDHYDIDLTKFSYVSFSATTESGPIDGESIDVFYRNSNFSVSIENGEGHLRLPYYKGEIVRATLRDKIEQKELMSDKCYIEFYFEKEQKNGGDREELPIKTIVEISAFINDKPAANNSVKVEYDGQVYSGTIDLNGKYSVEVTLVDGKTCNVSVGEFDVQNRELQNISSNQFKFEKNILDVLPPKSFIPYVVVKGMDESTMENYPIKIEYEGLSKDYKTDMNGVVCLYEMMDGKKMRVTDLLNEDNITLFTLNSNQVEYILKVPYRKMSTSNDIQTRFIDYKKKPIKCDRIRFQQDDKQNERDFLSYLDDDGVVYLSNGSFEVNKDIKVSLLGTLKDYGPITFTLEPNETEYVFQEKKHRSKWMNILIQGIVLIIMMIALLQIWTIFKTFCFTFI